MFLKFIQFAKKSILFFKLISTLLLALSLTSQAKDNIGDTQATLEGRAVKGVLANARVDIYTIKNGVPDTSPVFQGITDASGNFSFNIPKDTISESLYVEVKPNGNSENPSLMHCDSFVGCATRNWMKTDFGETFPLKNNFLLKSFSVYDPSSNSFPIKLTPFEHMAVAYAQSLPKGLTKENFQQGLSYLSDIFLFSDSVQSLEAINLISAEETASASDDDIVAAIISSAFLAIDNSILRYEKIETILEKLSLQKGILAKTHETDSTEISLPLIAEKALNNIPTYLENRPTVRAHLERIKIAANSNTVGTLLNLEVAPGGKIISPSHLFECTDSCQFNLPENERVKLEAISELNFNFNDWGGACANSNDQTSTSCDIILSGNPTVSAGFTKQATILPNDANVLLAVSDNTERQNPQALQLSTVSGNIYIIVTSDPHIKQVDFFLDATSGTPHRTERSAPFDFAGPNKDGSAAAFDTSTLSDGKHFIYAVVTLSDGSMINLKSFFNVNNSSTPIEYTTLTIYIEGAGSVSEINSGFSCEKSACSVTLPKGFLVNLNAAPFDRGTDIFSGWQGLCEGEGDCIRSIDTEQTITARFSQLAPAPLPEEQLAIMVSQNPDRSNPMPLASETLAGPAYIMVPDHPNIEQVNFYINTTTGTPFRTENNAPYDLNGGTSNGTANPFDTTALNDGSHFIFTSITLNDGSIMTLKSVFEVQNSVPEPIEYVMLTMKIEGSGSVSELNSNFTCQTSNCSLKLPKGYLLNLTAAPLDNKNYIFSTWQGLCEGNGDCIHTLNSDQVITATFTELVQETPKVEPLSIELAVSRNSDRSNPALLESSTLSGLVYIELLSAVPVKQVAFFLDTSSDNTDTALKIENNAPYDFLGSDAQSNPKPLDTTTLSDGSHYIFALVILEDDSVMSVRSDFTILNTQKNTISWTPSEERESGTALAESEISKYIIYYGKSSRNYTGAIEISKRDANNLLPKAISVDFLEPGITYYFAGVTVDANGISSALSNEVSRLIEAAQ